MIFARIFAHSEDFFLLSCRYYDKLYHEYVICDLKGYKKDRIGFRWQTQQEMMQGKGQMR